MQTIEQVEKHLLTKKDNVTARRWSKNRRIKLRLLEYNQARNGEMLKINRIDFLQHLEESIDYCLAFPELVDDQFSS